jgi:glycosyltransferase involved in cell wall biosynthesis
MNKPEASVVVSVYNAAFTIEACISSLMQQTIACELLFVDDGSTDETVSIIKKYPPCQLFRTKHHGPAHARNHGVTFASAPIVVFVDADMTFEPDFIEHLIAPIQNGQTKGTWTKEEKVMNWDKPLARAWNMEYTHQTRPMRVPPNSSDKGPVFRAILKTEFDRVHGFSEIGYTDDWTLSQKLHYQADAAPGAIMYHKNPDTWTTIKKQAMWIAKRQYKWGEWGRLIGLIRASLIPSIIYACVGGIRFQALYYIPFKIWYDFAILQGIVQYWCTQNGAK